MFVCLSRAAAVLSRPLCTFYLFSRLLALTRTYVRVGQKRRNAAAAAVSDSLFPELASSSSRSLARPALSQTNSNCLSLFGLLINGLSWERTGRRRRRTDYRAQALKRDTIII